jgi:molybdopterin-guanine dinucleotide biosynthesis protein A
MTWLERSVSLLERVCSTVVIAGSGRLPERLADTPRVPDVPDVTGPLAGILAAMRWLPDASWLMTACDMPTLSPDVLMWLLAQRRPGVWAVLPSDADNAVCQPLPAYYNSRCGSVLAAACHRNNVGPSMLIDHPKTESPAIPPALAGAWRNVNTPSELAAIQDDYNNMQPR